MTISSLLYNDISVLGKSLIDLLYTVNTPAELLPRLATKRFMLHIHSIGDFKRVFRTRLYFCCPYSQPVVYHPLLVISPKHIIVISMTLQQLVYPSLQSNMAVTNADNTSMNSDTSSSPPPAAPPVLSETESLGEGEFFKTTGSGTRKFYRIVQFDRANKKSSLQSKGIVKKKKKKDLNAPKKALSAYFLFMNKNRPMFKAELEKSGLKGKELNTSVAKMAGEKWKTLTEDDKKEFNDMHAQEKQKYDEEMKNYQPPAAEDQTA